jgi:hypothetical protein
MPITFPPEAAGQTRVSQRADQIYINLIWIARLSNELVNDPNVDMKKLGQLAYTAQSHGGRFLALTANGGADLMAAVLTRFQAENIVVDQARLLAIRAQVQALVDAVGVPPEWPAATRIWTPAGEIERSIVEPKPHSIEPFVQAVRNEFT